MALAAAPTNPLAVDVLFPGGQLLFSARGADIRVAGAWPRLRSTRNANVPLNKSPCLGNRPQRFARCGRTLRGRHCKPNLCAQLTFLRPLGSCEQMVSEETREVKVQRRMIRFRDVCSVYQPDIVFCMTKGDFRAHMFY